VWRWVALALLLYLNPPLLPEVGRLNLLEIHFEFFGYPGAKSLFISARKLPPAGRRRASAANASQSAEPL